MIYFLVNNDYHLNLDLKLAKQLNGFELGLIQVPYSLDVVNRSNVFSKIYHYPKRVAASWYRILLRPKELLNTFKNVDEDLIPEPGDMLLVHTEIDILNQYIIQKFYDSNAKIYLIEDGTATMCYFNMVPEKPSIIYRLKAIILRRFYNLKYTDIKKYGAEVLPVMKDIVFKGVIVSLGNSIGRKIPLYKLKSLERPIGVKYPDGATFFSQALYFWFCTEDQYVSYIDGLLLDISKKFSPFYFKFHPSDTESVKLSITKIINDRHKSVVIIDENDIAENLIIKYPVKYAITFNSTAVFNLINRGIVPIFLNNIFSKTYYSTSFAAFDQFLKSIDCFYPAAISTVKPGFNAFANGISHTNANSIINILSA